MGNTQRLMIIYMIFLTSAGLAVLKLISSRICTMVLKRWFKKKLNLHQSQKKKKRMFLLALTWNLQRNSQVFRYSLKAQSLFSKRTCLRKSGTSSRMKKTTSVLPSKKRSLLDAKTLILVLVFMLDPWTAIINSLNSLTKSFLIIMVIRKKISMSAIWTIRNFKLLHFQKRMQKWSNLQESEWVEI